MRKHREHNNDRVRHFHEATGSARDQPVTSGLIGARWGFIKEEFEESREALTKLELALDYPSESDKDMPTLKAQALKELTDLKYVIEGTLVAFGWPSEEAERAVHENNMTKVKGGVRRREDGKILKPEGYKPVDLRSLIEATDLHGRTHNSHKRDVPAASRRDHDSAAGGPG